MLSGDPNPWRDIGHARWYDPLAPLEDTKSKEFQEAVQEETAIWDNAIQPFQSRIRSWVKGIKDLYSAALPHTEEYAHEQMMWNGRIVKIQHTFGHRMNVWITTLDHVNIESYTNINNFGACDDSPYYFIIQDVGQGSETLELAVYNVEKEKPNHPVWTKKSVGPDAAFKGDKIYYQSVENQLRYPGVLCAEKKTGHKERELFHESDKRFQVELHKPAHQSDVFFRITNALQQRLGILVGNTDRIRWLSRKSHTLYPICSTIYAANSGLHIGSRKYAYPKGFLVNAVGNEERVYVTTVQKGYTHLYEFLPKQGSYKALYTPEFPCEINVLGYSTIPSVEIKVPNASSSIYMIVDHELVLLQRFPEPVAIQQFSHGLVKSKDGARVPYTIVSAVKNPRKLLVEAYGAYGISAHRSYPMRWLQWLQEGYAIVRAMPRGGREDGDAWYDGGRTAVRKQNTFDDTAAVIKMAQAILRIKPEKTVFYGRSAGGLLAANIAQQFPDLVGAVYAEVPYLDVLRTTTNPDLPLTQLEYDEFGDPAKRPQEYVALQRISPVDTVPLAKKDSPLIIVKTAVNDTQVLPYEALKWSKKLRANGFRVYTGIDGQGGHFAAESSMYQQQAEDAVLIDDYLAAAPLLVSRTRRSRRSHTSRGATRRRTSS